MCAYFTVVSYLFVGIIAVRILTPNVIETEIQTSYLNYFSKTVFKNPEVLEITVPEQKFNKIKIKEERKYTIVRMDNREHGKKKEIRKELISRTETKKIDKIFPNFSLPFHAAIELSPIKFQFELPEKLAELYNKKIETVIANESNYKEDVVSTLQASPYFYEYNEKIDDSKKMDKEKTHPVKESLTVSKISEADESALKNNLESESTYQETEEVAVDELVAFDYPTLKEDLINKKIQVVSKVDNHLHKNENSTLSTQKAQSINQENKFEVKNTQKLASQTIQAKKDFQKPNNAVLKDENYENRIIVSVVGTDLMTTQKEVGFEIRPQDDLKENYSDYNNGEVTIDQVLDTPNMTRTVTILKRGYAPTNTDLILEEGVSEVSIPMVSEKVFNNLLAPFESGGKVGVVLIELDEKTESASLDVSYSKIIKLNENMMPVDGDEYSYLMYVGVKVGNALLSYKDLNGEIVSKIVHVHEHELTFDSNFFEDVEDETVTFNEENLLSREKGPLIISSSQVHHFAKNKNILKKNNHTFLTNFNKTTLGGRKYLELTHLAESVFLGFKDTKKLEVPSENFMRYVLSSINTSNITNRCLIQVNLNKIAASVEVGTESVDGNFESKVQIIDSDGKFYDSLSTKSEKIIVSGEPNGIEDDGMDSKINFKITYRDNSVHYLSSYCSPNTYLVEQL